MELLRMKSITSLLITLLSLAILTHAQTLPCTHIPVDRCTCWDPDRPHVTCDSLNLTEIPEEVGTWQISVLQMSHNKIHSLKSEDFASSLLILKLDHNEIVTVENGTFLQSRSSLYLLDLDSNLLTRVPSDAIRILHNLRVLFLSNNQITVLGADDFRGLDSLKTVHLEGNDLVVMFEDGESTFARSGAELEVLFISLQGMMRVLEWDLQPGGLQFLRGLHFTDTDVIKPLSDDYFWPYLKHLQYLGLHRCEVRSLVEIDINGNDIVHLSLSHNNITQVKGWRFYNNFENLEILDLSYNRISEFQVQYFDDGWRKRWDKLPQTVKELNLRGNMLADFTDRDVVLELVNLEYLDLRDNLISSLEPILKNLSITPRPGLTIALSGNRLECSCTHKHLLKAISTQQEVGEGYFLLVELHHSLTCTTQEDDTSTLLDYIESGA